MKRWIIAVFASAWLCLGTLAIAAQSSPSIEVKPLSNDFGNVCSKQTSGATTFTIRNSGDATLDIDGITKNASSSDPDDFNLDAPNQQFTLAPDETKKFAVSFAPKSQGTKTAKITVHSTNASSKSVTVKGDGLDIQIVSEPSTVSFGNQRVGTRSPTKTLVLRNPGTDTLFVSGVKLVGVAAADFLAQLTTFSIAPGDFRTVSVAFQPRGAGLRNAGLEFTSNACSKPKLVVPLVGTGVVPNVLVAPNPIDLGGTPQGVPSQPTAITIRNDGGASLKITAVQILGADAAEFALAGLPPMPATIIPGESLVFSVRMTPTVQGSRAASLNVVSDDPDTPALAVALRGTGGTPSPSPSSSATASPTTSPSPSPSGSSKPRALPGGPPNDSLAIWLVVGAVLASFGGLIVVRRMRTAGEEEW